jgi:predicted nucleotidyltransferase
MRLSNKQIQIIVNICAEIVGEQARVLLYGSRLDDSKKGGDVDLLVEADTLLTMNQRAKLKLALESQLHLPVDILVAKKGATEGAFLALARHTAIPLVLPTAVSDA